jgi:hypothetical protein
MLMLIRSCSENCRWRKTLGWVRKLWIGAGYGIKPGAQSQTIRNFSVGRRESRRETASKSLALPSFSAIFVVGNGGTAECRALEVENSADINGLLTPARSRFERAKLHTRTVTWDGVPGKNGSFHGVCGGITRKFGVISR